MLRDIRLIPKIIVPTQKEEKQLQKEMLLMRKAEKLMQLEIMLMQKGLIMMATLLFNTN